MPDLDLIIALLLAEGEEITGAELDDRFLNLLITLGTDRGTQDLAFRAWLKVTDFQRPEQAAALTVPEWNALMTVCHLIEQGEVQ